MQPTPFDRLSGLALAELDRLAAVEAALFAASARVLVEVAALAERAGGLDGLDRCVELDLAGTLRTGQLGAGRRLADAQRLVQVLPGVLGALESGVLLLPQARLVLTETAQCREDVAAEVERRVLALQDGPGGLAGWVSSRLTRKVKALVLAVEAELDAAATADRQRRARAGRRVVVRSEPDGMASLWALLGAEQARVFAAGLDELTRRQRLADRSAGVDRTADQRRADLLAALPALVLHAQDGTLPRGLWPTDPTAAPGGQVVPAGAPAPHPGATPASGAWACGGDATGRSRGVPDLTAGGLLGHPSVVVHVHVPVATALGLSHEPGVLAGYGPVDAAHVRLLLPTATLRRTLVDASTGLPLADDDHADAAASTSAGSSTAASDPGAGSRPAGSRGHWSTSPPGRQRRSQRRPPGGPPDGRPRSPQELEADLRALLPDIPLWLTDPDEPQHDPSAALTRLVQLRDPTCTGPGCSVPADRCDADHLQPWPAGPTAAGNLRPKSRRCHRAKTFTWTVTDDLTGDGSTVWTSPTGRRYTVPSPWSPPPEPLHRISTADVPPDVLPPLTTSRERDLLDDLAPRPDPAPPAAGHARPTGWPDDPGF